jgi:hypothetical protein
VCKRFDVCHSQTNKFDVFLADGSIVDEPMQHEFLCVLMSNG